LEVVLFGVGTVDGHSLPIFNRLAVWMRRLRFDWIFAGMERILVSLCE
jgi:hypothetical protein